MAYRWVNFSLSFYIIKDCHSHASAHTGVGIPFKFAEFCLKMMGIAPQAFPSVTTPACGLVRNDMVFWSLAASI